MACVIGKAHKLLKQNRKQFDNITDPYSATSTPSYSCYKLNEYTDIANKNHSLQRHILSKTNL